MKNLPHRDLHLLLSAIEELNSDLDTKTLPARAIAAASKIISADSVAFTGISFSGEYAGIGWYNSEEVSSENLEIFAEYLHEQPLLEEFIVKRRMETLRITDLMPAREFRRTNLYNEFYRRVGVANQLVTPMKISDDFLMTCSINTIKEDFSERDKLILTLAAPHIASAVRNSFAYERLNSALETEECGVVAVNAKGKTAFVSDFARRLFETYFAGEKYRKNSLPASLESWLKDVNITAEKNDFNIPPEPLKIENQHGVLIIRRMFNSTTRETTLLLEEKKHFSPAMFEKLDLTNREKEVMALIAQGKTDDVISMLLGISLRTVHKHVENIYKKLGVETRTAAMLRALEMF